MRVGASSLPARKSRLASIEYLGKLLDFTLSCRKNIHTDQQMIQIGHFSGICSKCTRILLKLYIFNYFKAFKVTTYASQRCPVWCFQRQLRIMKALRHTSDMFQGEKRSGEFGPVIHSDSCSCPTLVCLVQILVLLPMQLPINVHLEVRKWLPNHSTTFCSPHGKPRLNFQLLLSTWISTDVRWISEVNP